MSDHLANEEEEINTIYSSRPTFDGQQRGRFLFLAKKKIYCKQNRIAQKCNSPFTHVWE
jgi:hypothetical protein